MNHSASGNSKRVARTVAVMGALACTASLLLAHVHPFGNAGLYGSRDAKAPLLTTSSLPPDVRATLSEKCADCHSTESKAPIYGRLAPVSWLMERDILKGRRAMNLSLWDRYSAEQQDAFKAKIVQETKAGEMPLPQYRMIHWNARISDRDMQRLTQWARGKAGDDSSAQPVHEGDPVRGREAFEKRCTGCHALTSEREGPRLQGVFGRTSGTVEGFAYSTALKNAHIVWDESSLEKWLTDPDVLVPGNNMEFHVPKAQERMDLAAFLKQSSNK
jgi:cytochrome c